MRLALVMIVVLALLLVVSVCLTTGCVGGDVAPIRAPLVNAPASSQPAKPRLSELAPDIIEYLQGIREMRAELEMEEQNQAGLVNALAKVEASLARVDAKLTIGGGGDSVTAWVYAVGGLGLVAWLAYPLVWRPLRRRLERGTSEDREPGPADPHPVPSEPAAE